MRRQPVLSIDTAARNRGCDSDLVREPLARQRAKREPLIALIEARRHPLAVLTGKRPEAASELPRPTPLYAPPPTGYVPAETHVARLPSARTELLPRFGIQFPGGWG